MAGGAHHASGGGDAAVADAERCRRAIAALRTRGGDVHAPFAVKARGRSGPDEWQSEAKQKLRGEEGFLKLSHDVPLWFGDGGTFASGQVSGCDDCHRRAQGRDRGPTSAER